MDFSDMDLRNVNFRGSSLRGAIFTGASVKGADFEAADVYGVNFKKTDIEAVQLEAAKNVQSAFLPFSTWLSQIYRNLKELFSANPFDKTPRALVLGFEEYKKLDKHINPPHPDPVVDAALDIMDCYTAEQNGKYVKSEYKEFLVWKYEEKREEANKELRDKIIVQFGQKVLMSAESSALEMVAKIGLNRAIMQLWQDCNGWDSSNSDELKGLKFLQSIEAEINKEKVFTQEEFNLMIASSNVKPANFTNADLRHLDLRGANFSYTILDNANMQGANLKGARFNHASAEGVNLRNANLQKICIIDTSLCGADLRDTNLTDSYMHNVELQYANMSRANMTNAVICECECAGTSFKKVQFKNTDFKGSKMFYTDFNDTDIANAKLTKAEIKDCIMPPVVALAKSATYNERHGNARKDV
jgi:uncharacterized protein YjbI with pentapeptide repeats